ncbi:EamA family transporter [Ignatzschineria ureiclastica]|uniref:EamA family transporter n=1 Tax=Ignatzschineria ureiclastica TaxID=472582 RepID=A0A2U2ADL0_9GAMM|nr:DMT family transporter [Ignatzschineria ureiclastica]PWD80755.1 EamA family transporter [Ignatzschineria ureiclastica]GGZ94854.1 transporter [Ignatzschineria ureiclastica]
MAGRPNVLYGALLLIIASASWGAMFPVAGEIFKVVNPYYFTLLRYVPVAIILAIILYLKEGPSAFRAEGHLPMIWFFGTMGFTVYNLLMFIGQEQLGDPGVLIASIMEASVPILSAIVMWVYYRSRPNNFTLCTILIAFVGVALVVTNGDFSTIFSGGRLIPFLFLLIAALGWALYTIGGSRLPQWSVLRYSTLSLIYGMLTTFIIVMVGTAMGKISVPTLPEIFSVKYHFLFMILFPGLFALLGWNKGVQSLGPLNAVLFINIAPITTVIIRLIQGHGVEPLELTGVIIVCSMIIANNINSRYQYRRQLRDSIHESMPNYKDESEEDETPAETIDEITPIDRV